MKNLKFNTVMAAAMAAVIALPSQNSFAAEVSVESVDDDDRGVIIITTRKREETVMDVGIALTVFGHEELEDAGIVSIDDLASLTPGLTNAPIFGSGSNTPVIRGLSTTIGESNVGFFVDGIYQSSKAMMEAMLGTNINQVEIAKGPQSALYGRNTFGGAINFITKIPSTEPEGQLDIGFGSEGSRNIRFTHSGPIQDLFEYRVWLNSSSRDGYYTNELNGDDLDDRSSNIYGFNLFGGEKDDFYWTFTVGIENTSDGDDALRYIENNIAFVDIGRAPFPAPDFQLFEGEVPSLTEGFAVTPGHKDRDNLHSSLKLNWHFGDMSFTSITGFNNTETDFLTDTDYEIREIHQTSTNLDLTEISQEFRLQSETDSDFEWTAGFYYYDLDSDTNTSAGYLGLLEGIFGGTQAQTNETTEELALFGSAGWTLSDNWKLILSGRFFTEEKTINANTTNLLDGTINPPFVDSVDFSEFTPRIDVEYTTENNGLVYASVAKAIKSGGFNAFVNGTIADSERIYDTESSINYELGYKKSYPENHVDFTAALFMINWDDQIVRDLGQFFALLNVNAGETTSKGFELEINARPTENLTVRAGLAYTDSSYDSYDFAILGILGIDPMLNGTELQYVSEWQSNLSLQYRGGQVWDDFNWFSRFDVSYQSGQSLTQNAAARTPDRSLANLRFGAENNDWRIHFWVNNIFEDDSAPTGVFFFNPTVVPDLFVFGERTGLPLVQGLINAPNPRTYGLNVIYNF